MKTLLIAMSCIVLAGCSGTTNQSYESARLLAVDSAFASLSVRTNAPDAFRAYFDDSAVMLPASSDPVRGRDSIAAYLKRSGIPYVLDWKPMKAEVAAGGDLGYTWGTSTLTYSDSGRQVVIRGKYCTVWKHRADHSWRAILDIGNQKRSEGQ